mmetsp:Transcript_5204/g.17281  ORF Transcript_5204/g.17281 Transcript_5204/m.17281 type:complete len:303 (+) Transcript_5204:644-1552(+)
MTQPHRALGRAGRAAGRRSRRRCYGRRARRAVRPGARRGARWRCSAPAVWPFWRRSSSTPGSTNRISSTPSATVTSPPPLWAWPSVSSTPPRLPAASWPAASSTAALPLAPHLLNWPCSACSPPEDTRRPRQLGGKPTMRRTSPCPATGGAWPAPRQPSACGDSQTRRRRRTPTGCSVRHTPPARRKRVPSASTRWCSHSAGASASRSCPPTGAPPWYKWGSPRCAALWVWHWPHWRCRAEGWRLPMGWRQPATFAQWKTRRRGERAAGIAEARRGRAAAPGGKCDPRADAGARWRPQCSPH